MENATILNPALDCLLKINKLEMKHSSSIVYGSDALWLDVSSKFNISGLIYPKELNYGETSSSPTVFILAGIGTPEPAPTEEEEEEVPDFIFDSASGIIGDSIQIFSDRSISINGTLNNYYRNHDSEWKLAQHCFKEKERKTDVFRCVNQGLKAEKNILTPTLLINRFNEQFPSDRPIEKYSELFTQMTKDYSIYIQSLSTINIPGSITGNRIGLCSSNLNITGSINATEGGCPQGTGLGAPEFERCCNNGGGSYGGFGISGTPNTNNVGCSLTQED